MKDVIYIEIEEFKGMELKVTYTVEMEKEAGHCNTYPSVFIDSVELIQESIDLPSLEEWVEETISQ